MLFETEAQEQHACCALSDACRLVQCPGLGQYLQDLVAATRRVQDNLATSQRSDPAILPIDITECQAVEGLHDLEGGLGADEP